MKSTEEMKMCDPLSDIYTDLHNSCSMSRLGTCLNLLLALLLTKCVLLWKWKNLQKQ